MNGRVGFSALWLLAGATLAASGQWKEPPSTGSPSNQLPDRTILAGQAGMGPLLVAALVDPKNNAKNHNVVIEVQTDGISIVDPATVHGKPKSHEGHLQYRLDNGPIENTTSKTWRFEHLPPGEHLIRVALASSDNHQIGETRSLRIKVP